MRDQYIGRGYSKRDFDEPRKNLQFMSAYLLIIGKEYFVEIILKLKNIQKRSLRGRLVTDIKC